MNGWRLFQWVLWRGILCGAVLGALFGMTITTIYALNGYFAVCLIGLLVGAILGGFLGGIVSALDGLALVILTRLFFNPINNVRRYRWSALLLTTICTVAGSILAVHLLFGDLVYVLIPVTLLAPIAAGYFAWRLPNAVAYSNELHHPSANAVLFYIEK
jgi:hypothetical protein